MSHGLLAGQVEGLGASNILLADSSSSPPLWKQRPIPKMPLYLFIPVCISVGGISEQHQVLWEDTATAKTWEASGKPGHSDGKKPEAPHGSYYRVLLCSGEELGAEQPDLRRQEWCVPLQPALVEVPFLLCDLCSWQMACVIPIDWRRV